MNTFKKIALSCVGFVSLASCSDKKNDYNLVSADIQDSVFVIRAVSPDALQDTLDFAWPVIGRSAKANHDPLADPKFSNDFNYMAAKSDNRAKLTEWYQFKNNKDQDAIVIKDSLINNFPLRSIEIIELDDDHRSSKKASYDFQINKQAMGKEEYKKVSQLFASKDQRDKHPIAIYLGPKL